MILIMIKVLMLVMLIGQNDCYYNKVLDKADNVLYLYPKNGETIADVKWCGENEPCGVVSKRFWLPRMVTRPCRCKNLPCNTEYSSNQMKQDTVQLDNRSQFKMCNNGDSDINIERCQYGAGMIGVSVEDVYTISNIGTDQGNTHSKLTERNVYVNCRCIQGYWQLSRHTLDKINSTTELHKNLYHCNKLSRCKKGDFCGHVRGDTHTAYYKCSCPLGSLCINTDKTLRNASELLYDGPMYRAYCQPVSNNVEETAQQD